MKTISFALTSMMRCRREMPPIFAKRRLRCGMPRRPPMASGRRASRQRASPAGRLSPRDATRLAGGYHARGVGRAGGDFVHARHDAGFYDTARLLDDAVCIFGADGKKIPCQEVFSKPAYSPPRSRASHGPRLGREATRARSAGVLPMREAASGMPLLMPLPPTMAEADAIRLLALLEDDTISPIY